MTQLGHPLRVGQVTKPMGTQLGQPRTVGEPIGHQLHGPARQHRLAAMRQITQPRGAVDPRCREPIVIMKLHLTGAHPDAQPDRQQRGPLQLQRGRHRIGGPGERHLKTVTLAMFDRPHPAMGSDDIGHEFVQAAHRGGHDARACPPTAASSPRRPPTAM